MAFKDYYIYQFAEDIKYALDWLFAYARKHGKKIYGWSGDIEAVNDWNQVNMLVHNLKGSHNIMWLKKYIIKNNMR